ncbi:MAG TPA: YciI family protein [Caulobacteraceae bacterium]|nr:YciI family protein [Caulobacteraceae bacterium]
MRYLLLLHVDEGGWARLTPAEQAEGMATYARYNEALGAAGALVSAGRLAPSAGALAIRTIGGRLVTMDGPFAETKEQIGGYYLIEAADLETALDWARRCPAAGHGTVEVRQLI